MSSQPTDRLPTELAGWGHHPVVEGPVIEPSRLAELTRQVREADVVGARGQGRSYGDSALPASDGLTVQTRWFDRWRSFDPEQGVVHVEAGVSIRALVEGVLPRGWFVPVTPGTQQVTVGGAVASDVHGKNHHADGSFGEHVLSLGLVLADGRYVRCSASDEPDLFWATIGGMGLTGLIVDVELQLRPVETAWIRERAIRCKDWSAMLEAFAANAGATYSVAWLDISGGRRPGRGVLLLGEHATKSSLGDRRDDVLQLDRRRRLAVPRRPPLNLLNSLSVKLFNQAFYLVNGSKEHDVHYGKYFYPLDAVVGWNRLYGPDGFLQYQLVVPESGGAALLERVFDEVKRYGRSSFLSVLKRMGPASAGPLSFSVEGWTLTMDFPRRPELFPFLDRLDALVLEAGGRVYLTKDARLPAATFRQMYPRYEDWLAVKRHVDPTAKFRSAQSHRLGIDADVTGVPG